MDCGALRNLPYLSELQETECSNIHLRELLYDLSERKVGDQGPFREQAETEVCCLNVRDVVVLALYLV